MVSRTQPQAAWSSALNSCESVIGWWIGRSARVDVEVALAFLAAVRRVCTPIPALTITGLVNMPLTAARAEQNDFNYQLHPILLGWRGGHG